MGVTIGGGSGGGVGGGILGGATHGSSGGGGALGPMRGAPVESGGVSVPPTGRPGHAGPINQPVRPTVDVFSVPWWGDDPDAWGSLVLDETLVLGLAVVDVSLGRKIESKSAAGSDGATVRDKGYEAARLTITLSLWEREHFVSLQGLLVRINPRSRLTARVPLSISHPACALLGVTAVYVERVGGLKPSGEAGMWSMEIHCVEFAPPTPARRNVTRVPAASPDAGLDQATAFADNTAAHPGQAAASLSPIPPPSPSATATGPRRH